MNDSNNIPKPPIPPVPPQDKERVNDHPKGKVPPQAVDLEISVLGAILINRKAIEEVIDILSPEVFFKMQHRLIFVAMQQLHERDEGIDLLTLPEELRRTGHFETIGGDYYLVQIANKISSAVHIEYHARIILQKYILRELISNSRHIEMEAYQNDPDVFKLIEEIENNILRIQNVAVKPSRKDLYQSPEEELKAKMERVRSGEQSGVYIGVEEFDQISGGLQDREIIVIAGRPGMGKTAISISIIKKNVLEYNRPVAFFSLEMSKTDISNRFAAGMTGIPFEKIRKAELTDQEFEHIQHAWKRLEESPVTILDSTHHKNIFERIVSDIRKLVREGKCHAAIIDYLQIMKLAQSKGTETADLNEMTGQLKALANELNIPIVELSQLNRDVDKRPEHRPILADLKQSGSIEQDADMVIFPVREAYYKQKEAVEKGGVPPVPNPKEDAKTLFIVAKGRSVPVRDFITYMDFNKYNLTSYFESEI